MLSIAEQAIQTSGSNVNVQVQALIEANLNATAQALTDASQTINGAITAAGGNIANASPASLRPRSTRSSSQSASLFNC